MRLQNQLLQPHRGRMAMRRACAAILAAMIALAALPVSADMFVWKDPQTGRTRMSNIAPPWLRDPQPPRRAPKVDVIRERAVIDAVTAFAIPQEPARPSEKQLAGSRREPPPAGVAAAENDDD